MPPTLTAANVTVSDWTLWARVEPARTATARSVNRAGSTRIEPPHVDERQRAEHLPHRYRELLTYLRWRVRDLDQRDVHALDRLIRNVLLIPRRDEAFTPPSEVLHETAHPRSAAPFVFRRNQLKAGPALPVECLHAVGRHHDHVHADPQERIVGDRPLLHPHPGHAACLCAERYRAGRYRNRFPV